MAVPRFALTNIHGDFIFTCTLAGVTRIGIALVDVHPTVFSFEPRNTAANITFGLFIAEVPIKLGPDVFRNNRPYHFIKGDIGPFKAHTVVLARCQITLVNIFVTIFALVAGETLASVVFDAVHACSIVGTWVTFTLLDVDLTG
jgi:hypothetical protein